MVIYHLAGVLFFWQLSGLNVRTVLSLYRKLRQEGRMEHEATTIASRRGEARRGWGFISFDWIGLDWIRLDWFSWLVCVAARSS